MKYFLSKRGSLGFVLLAAVVECLCCGEFDVKREPVFEFASAPRVERNGDKITISFATKGYCDVTVVIEDADNRIVRHLGSGVLGKNAPKPFLRNSKQQKVVWDGKDDTGAYVGNIEMYRVRVSLGLDPQLEKVLFWEPKLGFQHEALLMAAAPEGVYVFDGRVFDNLRLFDHSGEYKRTVYPFPADKIREVRGLHWRRFPQDGQELPLKEGFHQATFLTSGTNAGFDEKLGIGVDRFLNYHGAVFGNAASTLAVRGKRIAIGRIRINRLSTDGSSGELQLTGPEVTYEILRSNYSRRKERVVPRSAAFSPDGKWLYLTGYVYGHRRRASRDIVLVQNYDWLSGVVRVKYESNEKPEVFLGGMQLSDAGDDDRHFRCPTSVAVDALGRVYVSDYANDRIQVYDSRGRYLKTIKTRRPAQVVKHQRTQQIFVFSWYVPCQRVNRDELRRFKSTLACFKSFEDPGLVFSCALPVGAWPTRGCGMPYRAEVDSWVDPPRVRLVSEWSRRDFLTRDKLRYSNIRIYRVDRGRLVLERDFREDIKRSVVRVQPPEYSRQRLYVNPATGVLYVAEGQAMVGKSFKQLVEIDPGSGRVRIVPIPFDAEDMCFGYDGLAYLRTFYVVARYDPRTWREVPYDYGEEYNVVRTSSSNDGKSARVISAIRLPVRNAGLHHHGGMGISPRGHLIVAVNNHGKENVRRRDIYFTAQGMDGVNYTPGVYPGRVRWGEVHVWDRHGRIIYDDVFPGIAKSDGVATDNQDNIYVLSTATRVIRGKPYFNDMTGTLIKVRPKKAKVVSASERAPVPLPEEHRPSRPPDLYKSVLQYAWVEGAEWFYGGLGFSGKNAGRSGGGCDCYNARFALDYLGRSFAPEVDHYSIAVIDTNGNLILRIGQYGNADSAGKDSLVPLGGDEVGLMYAPYVATHTDRRLFIADAGNARILSVRLNYHTTRIIPLGTAD